MNGQSEFEVMVEDVVGGKEGKCVTERGMDAPEKCVNLPAKVLEKVDDWLEGIIGSWLWLG